MEKLAVEKRMEKLDSWRNTQERLTGVGRRGEGPSEEEALAGGAGSGEGAWSAGVGVEEERERTRGLVINAYVQITCQIPSNFEPAFPIWG